MGIKEIADKAGVSKTTVSLALNGHKGVSHETRKQIIEIAREMNYRVPGERPVTTTMKGSILLVRIRKHGLYLNQDQSIFIMDYIDSINEAVTSEGYLFEIFECQCQNLDIAIENIQNKNASGAIIIGTELEESDLEALSKLTTPFVVLDTFSDEAPCDFVDMANVGAVYKIISHLVDYGHSWISMVTSSKKSGNILMRQRGFSLGMEKKELEVTADSFITVEPGFDGAYHSMKAYLEQKKPLPQALFCYNDVAAFGVIKALKEIHMKVPRDISIVGFDDLPMASMMEPHLTSVRIPTHHIAQKAVNMLLKKLETKRVHEPVSLLVHGELIIRNSVLKKT